MRLWCGLCPISDCRGSVEKCLGCSFLPFVFLFFIIYFFAPVWYKNKLSCVPFASPETCVCVCFVFLPPAVSYLPAPVPVPAPPANARTPFFRSFWRRSVDLFSIFIFLLLLNRGIIRWCTSTRRYLALTMFWRSCCSGTTTARGVTQTHGSMTSYGGEWWNRGGKLKAMLYQVQMCYVSCWFAFVWTRSWCRKAAEVFFSRLGAR